MQILMSLICRHMRFDPNPTTLSAPVGTGGTRVASVAVLEENKQGAWQQSQDHIHGMA